MWYKNIRGTLLAIGYTKNEYDQCVFNKYETDGVQITVGIHVKELLITSEPDRLHEELKTHLRKIYGAITVKEGLAIDYVGMTFNFSHQGKVRVNMSHCVQDILTGVRCRVPPLPPGETNSSKQKTLLKRLQKRNKNGSTLTPLRCYT